MKVMMLVDTFRTGGKERQLYHLLKMLSGQPSLEVHLVLMDQTLHFPNVDSLVRSVHYVVRSWKCDYRVISKLARLVREIKPDLIHSWDPLTAAFGAGVAKYYGTKFINGMIRNAPQLLYDPLWPFLVAFLTIPISNVVVANTHAGLQAYHVPSAKGVCIHNMYDNTRQIEPTGSGSLGAELGYPGSRLVGMVASFSRFKDYRTYLAAAHIILRSAGDVVFLAVGDGPMLEEMKKLVAPDVSKRILFLGRRTDIDRIVQSLDVAVFTSRREGMSNVLMEYMAWGKPIVTTAEGGTRELLPDGRYAYLLPPGHIASVVDAILDVLRDPQKAAEMGRRAQSRLLSSFTAEQFLTGYLNVYNSVLGMKAGE